MLVLVKAHSDPWVRFDNILTSLELLMDKIYTAAYSILCSKNSYYILFSLLTHSVLNSGEPTFPIELNRKQKHFQRNAIIVENYYCIANTSVTTKLHVLKICKLWFSFLIL